jgi:hypothetical protein
LHHQSFTCIKGSYHLPVLPPLSVIEFLCIYKLFKVRFLNFRKIL